MGLIVPCFISELGWELFGWQGHLRHISSQFDTVKTYCTENCSFLYEDFSDELVVLNKNDIDNSRKNGDICLPEVDLNKNDITVSPSSFGNDRAENLKNTKYISYKKPHKKEFDIVFHFRNRKWRQDENDPVEWCLELSDYMISKGLKISCIGAKDSSINPADHGIDCDDSYYGKPLKSAIDAINKSKLCVGHSSGPMHLACLCETPILVWSNSTGAGLRGEALKNRYIKVWNPFGSKVHFHYNRPKKEEILNTCIN